jgi:hypothetical protein
MSCLKKIYPNENFLEREVARGNSIDTVRNYYHYNSFSLSFGRDNEDLVIINFGAFIEHSPVYMLVFKVTGQNFGNQLLLGNQSLENDLKSLQSVFCCWGLKINEECKIEILDIYLQSKQGKLKTSIYKH